MAKDSKNAHLLQNNLQTATDTPPHHKLTTAPSRGYRYTLKLSKDPRFPKVPVHPRFRSVPCNISVTSSAYVWCKCRTLSICATGRTVYRLSLITGTLAISCERPFHGRPIFKISKNRMSRKDEFHILALVVVAPALLEACDFGALRKAWQAQPRRASAPRKKTCISKAG